LVRAYKPKKPFEGHYTRATKTFQSETEAMIFAAQMLARGYRGNACVRPGRTSAKNLRAARGTSISIERLTHLWVCAMATNRFRIFETSSKDRQTEPATLTPLLSIGTCAVFLAFAGLWLIFFRNIASLPSELMFWHFHF
jgi:hypothetical protein